MADEKKDKPLSPNTTEQEDIVTAGQRRINMIWETTQAVIAVVVVLSTMGASVYGYIASSNAEVPNILALAFGTVVGFYFSRTNHTAIGGVGPKTTDNQPDVGR